MCTSLSTYLRMRDKDKFCSNLGVLWFDISDSTGNTQRSRNWEIYEITNISNSTNAKLIIDLHSSEHLRWWMWSASFQLIWDEFWGAKNKTDIGHGSLDPDFQLARVPCHLQSATPNIPFFVPQVGAKDTGELWGLSLQGKRLSPALKTLETAK